MHLLSAGSLTIMAEPHRFYLTFCCFLAATAAVTTWGGGGEIGFLWITALAVLQLNL